MSRFAINYLSTMLINRKVPILTPRHEKCPEANICLGALQVYALSQNCAFYVC